MKNITPIDKARRRKEHADAHCLDDVDYTEVERDRAAKGMAFIYNCKCGTPHRLEPERVVMVQNT